MTKARVSSPAGTPTSRSAEGERLPAAPQPTGQGWSAFWFAPGSPLGLHILRLLAGLLFLYWLLPFAGQLEPLFGLEGWFDRRAYAEFGREIRQFLGKTPVNWSLLYLFGGQPAWLTIVYYSSLVILILFALGILPRLTALLTWVVVASFVANPATQDDADWLLPVLALYLLVGYALLGQGAPGQPWWWRVLGPWGPGRLAAAADPFWRAPSRAATLALRLLQVHFALVMVSSGLHKLQFGDWWAGMALWYPLHPPLETRMDQVQELRSYAGFYLFCLSLAAYAGLAWQLTFPLFAWRRGRWRLLLLGGGLVGCLSMAWLYRVPVFGPALLIFCLSYLTPAEWQQLVEWSRRGLQRLIGRRPLVGNVPGQRTS